jgi:hypothetical protein
VEAPVPTECITRASTIGSIRAKLALLDMSLWTLLGPFRGSHILLSPVHVIKTSTSVADPPDYVGRARELHPSIMALWHGQFFLLPGLYPREIPARAIVDETMMPKRLPAFSAATRAVSRCT